LCPVLPAGGGARPGLHRHDLSRRAAFRHAPGRGIGDHVPVSGRGHLAAARDLRLTPQTQKSPGSLPGFLVGRWHDQISKYFSRAWMNSESVPSVFWRTIFSAATKLSAVFLVRASPESSSPVKISLAAVAPASRISSGN